jgi:CheY-like chemotaxis protein
MAQVLIAEDDTVLARMYSKALEIEGIGVELVTNGEETIQKVRTNPPQLLLLDIMMPKMSGFQVLDILKADEHLKVIPVVVLTNLHSTEDTNLALSKGAAECIVKSRSNPMEVVTIAKRYLTQPGNGHIPAT